MARRWSRVSVFLKVVFGEELRERWRERRRGLETERPKIEREGAEERIRLEYSTNSTNSTSRILGTL